MGEVLRIAGDFMELRKPTDPHFQLETLEDYQSLAVNLCQAMNRNLSQNLENIRKKDSEVSESTKEKVVMNEDVA